MASKFYPNQPHEALREAFLNTDDKFIEKSKKQVSHIHPNQFWFNVLLLSRSIINMLLCVSIPEIDVRYNSFMCSISSDGTVAGCWLGRRFKSSAGFTESCSANSQSTQARLRGMLQMNDQHSIWLLPLLSTHWRHLVKIQTELLRFKLASFFHFPSLYSSRNEIASNRVAVVCLNSQPVAIA